MPPSTRKLLAVMNDESSLARNATALAMSAAVPSRPRGIVAAVLARFGAPRSVVDAFREAAKDFLRQVAPPV